MDEKLYRQKRELDRQILELNEVRKMYLSEGVQNNRKNNPLKLTIPGYNYNSVRSNETKNIHPNSQQMPLISLSFEPNEISARSTSYKPKSNEYNRIPTTEEILATSSSQDVRKLSLISCYTNQSIDFYPDSVNKNIITSTPFCGRTSSFEKVQLDKDNMENESFTPAEMMKAKLLADEKAWENEYADIPKTSSINSPPMLSFSSYQNDANLNSIKSDFSIGDYFNKRSENVRDMLPNKSPERSRPYALREASLVSNKSTSNMFIPERDSNSKKTFTLFKAPNIGNFGETQNSYANSSQKFSISGIEKAINNLNLDDISESVIKKFIKTKGKENRRSVLDCFQNQEKNPRNSLSKSKYKNSNETKIDKSEEKENVNPKINLEINLSDTASFSESVFECSGYKNMNQIQMKGNTPKDQNIRKKMESRDICNKLALPNSNNRKRSYSSSQIKEPDTIEKENFDIRRSKSPATYKELAVVSGSQIKNLNAYNDSKTANFLNDSEKTNELLYLMPSKSPDYGKLSLPNFGAPMKSSSSSSNLKYRCASQCSTTSETHTSGRLPLKATDLELSWGSIKLRKSVKKSLQIKNTSLKRLILKSEISGPGFQLANSQKNNLIILHGQECRTLDIIFCPTVIGGAIGKLIFSAPNELSNRQVIFLYGYGGHAIIYPEGVAKGPIGIPFITMGEYKQLAHPLEKIFSMRNLGPLKGFACVMIDSIGLDIPRLCDCIEVLPSKAIITPESNCSFQVIFKPRSDDIKKISKKISQVLTLANIKIITGDEATRQRIRKLIKTMNETEKKKLLNSSIAKIWETFPTETEISDLNIFEEKSDIALELFTSLRVHDIALTLNFTTFDDTFQTTLSLPEGDETILFRTIIPESSFVKPLNQNVESIKRQNGELWSVEPNILEIDPFDRTIKPILIIKSQLFSKQFFEIDSNFRHLFKFIPQIGEILPGGQVNILVSLQTREIPAGQITIIVFLETERIFIPVRIKKDNFQ